MYTGIVSSICPDCFPSLLGQEVGEPSDVDMKECCEPKHAHLEFCVCLVFHLITPMDLFFHGEGLRRCRIQSHVQCFAAE